MTVLDGLRPDGDVRSGLAFVENLRWPAEAGRRGLALDSGHRILWLLGPGELLPELGADEDWVRTPVHEDDLRDRSQQLAERSPSPTLDAGSVVVDDDGLVDYDGQRAVVSPIEAVILARLADDPERVVSRRELTKLVWNDDRRTPAALESRIHTLRRRLEPLRLTIHTIRGRGFLLAATPPTPISSVARQAPARSNPWSNS